MVVSKSLLAVGGFFVVLVVAISAAFFFLSRSTTTTSLPSENTQPTSANSKYKVSKLPIDGFNSLYVIEGKFTQDLSGLGVLSRAQFLIDGEDTDTIMVTFSGDKSNIAVGIKNAKGDMEWNNQPFSAIKSRIIAGIPVQLRMQLSTTIPEHAQQISMLDELIQASEIKPTYYSIQPDGIGFL
jgi:hypothetical protein